MSIFVDINLVIPKYLHVEEHEFLWSEKELNLMIVCLRNEIDIQLKRDEKFRDIYKIFLVKL